MAKDLPDCDKELAALWAAVADSIAAMSDDQILAELEEQGQDPDAVAHRVQSILATADKAYRQRHLRAAQEAYRRRVDEIETHHSALPQSPAERRRLLDLVIARKPDIASAIPTLHHHKFEDITDADVERLLTELDELGALADLTKQGDEP